MTVSPSPSSNIDCTYSRYRCLLAWSLLSVSDKPTRKSFVIAHCSSSSRSSFSSVNPIISDYFIHLVSQGIPDDQYIPLYTTEAYGKIQNRHHHHHHFLRISLQQLQHCSSLYVEYDDNLKLSNHGICSFHHLPHQILE